MLRAADQVSFLSMQKTCPVTGQTFETSEREMALRAKLGIEGEPVFHPVFRFMLLGAFWQHWNLHKRICDKTGKSIISVFPNDCPYPVWHKDEWLEHADPPSAEFNAAQPFFAQLWTLFQRCPIPHNIGAGNENCEYTDDWWYCKNCYLCHSGVECEDLRYCYRTIRVRDCQYCVFSFDSEKCVDLINCHNCFRVRYAYNCWQCSDSAFLYDCRNCTNCFFCANLRNKQYCIKNKQLTKEQYEEKVKAWDLRSRATYERATAAFMQMMREQAWHRTLFIDRSENATGNYLDECKNCENCFFLSTGMQDAVNVFRGGDGNNDCLDSVSPYHSQILFNSSLAQDNSYDIRCSYNVIQCKWLEYSAHCYQSQYCFGCCGLVGKKYHIFNKPYAPEEYEKGRLQIIGQLKTSGEYGNFFPGYFAATPYEESLSGFYWPLHSEQMERFGFRRSGVQTERSMDVLDVSVIPDRSDAATEDLTQKVFWDPLAARPFQIFAPDIVFAQDLGIPLPSTYYMRRLQENFRLIPFNGTLRKISCARCGQQTQTSWPEEYDSRILCEECYLKEVY